MICLILLDAYSYRYANDVQTGDHVLVPQGDELVTEKVIAVTTSKIHGRFFC